MCADQGPPTLDTMTLPETEMILWHAIESAVESADAPEQRKLLVQDYSKEAVRQAGFSKVRSGEGLILMSNTTKYEEYARSLGSTAIACSSREYK